MIKLALPPPLFCLTFQLIDFIIHYTLGWLFTNLIFWNYFQVATFNQWVEVIEIKLLHRLKRQRAHLTLWKCNVASISPEDSDKKIKKKKNNADFSFARPKKKRKQFGFASKTTEVDFYSIVYCKLNGTMA